MASKQWYDHSWVVTNVAGTCTRYPIHLVTHCLFMCTILCCSPTVGIRFHKRYLIEGYFLAIHKCLCRIRANFWLRTMSALYLNMLVPVTCTIHIVSAPASLVLLFGHLMY